jgi:hypothetical protein
MRGGVGQEPHLRISCGWVREQWNRADSDEGQNRRSAGEAIYTIPRPKRGIDLLRDLRVLRDLCVS